MIPETISFSVWSWPRSKRSKWIIWFLSDDANQINVLKKKDRIHLGNGIDIIPQWHDPLLAKWARLLVVEAGEVAAEVEIFKWNFNRNEKVSWRNARPHLTLSCSSVSAECDSCWEDMASYSPCVHRSINPMVKKKAAFSPKDSLSMRLGVSWNSFSFNTYLYYIWSGSKTSSVFSKAIIKVFIRYIFYSSC